MEVEYGIKRTAVLCILNNETQFLLLRRKKEPNKGLYTPVGGKLDPFEEPHAAAIRETWEETGIEVKNFSYCGSLMETSPTKYNWNSLVFMAEIPFQKAPHCPEGELAWIPFNQLKDLPTPTTDWFIYQYVAEGKPFYFNAVFDEELKLLSMKEEITQTDFELKGY